jgi:hypothetical protein
MNWLLAGLLLVGLFIAAYAVLLNEKLPIKNRLLVVFVLALPVIFYVVDYQKTYHQHKKDCETEGGLKILIELEKANQILIERNGSRGYRAAESFLKQFHPELKEVFFINSRGKDKGKYFSSKVISTTDDKYKSDWTFSHTETSLPSENLYVLKKEEFYDKAIHRHKQVWSLSKKGKLYATIINFDRFWPKIRYPDAVPGWACGSIDSHNYYRYPAKELVKQIIE